MIVVLHWLTLALMVYVIWEMPNRVSWPADIKRDERAGKVAVIQFAFGLYLAILGVF